MRNAASSDRRSCLLVPTRTAGRFFRALLDCYPLDDQQRALIAEYSANRKRWLSRPPPAPGCDDACDRLGRNRQGNLRRQPPQQSGSRAPKLREAGTPLKGPVDPSVPVMAVRIRTPAASDRLRLRLPQHDAQRYQWCGDYAGFAQIAVERNTLRPWPCLHGLRSDQNRFHGVR